MHFHKLPGDINAASPGTTLSNKVVLLFKDMGTDKLGSQVRNESYFFY